MRHSSLQPFQQPLTHGRPLAGRTRSPWSRAAFALALLPALAGACVGDVGPAGPPGASGPSGPPGPGASEPPPLVLTGAAMDVHAHLGSATLAELFAGPGAESAGAEDLIARLDEAHVQRAVVLAAGYLGWPVGITDDFNMAPENDFVAAEVAKYPDRLVGFWGSTPCSRAPWRDRSLPRLSGMIGVKLHLPGSGVDLTKPEDLAAFTAVIEKIDEKKAPALMHAGTEWGLALDTEGFTALALVLSQHPNLRMMHAHCAAPRDDQQMETWFREHLANENTFVETSACLHFYRDAPLSQRELMVWRFRKWGIDHVMFGSDYLQFQPEETPKEALETLAQYPFTQAEIDTILSNDELAWLAPRE